MGENGQPQSDSPGDADAQADRRTTFDMAPNADVENRSGDKALPVHLQDEREPETSWRSVEAGSAGDISNWLPQRAPWAILLERFALAVERPANRLIGTAQLNPFYHTGTIATLLLAIVALTGFFLFLFFQYGYDASYNAVLTRIETPFIARTIRAIHRYASGALLITSALHAFRILFMERFRGPRWLAWLTGIFMTGLLWLAGVSGYLLVWDQRAQVINDAFVDFLQATPFAAAYMVATTSAASSGVSWQIFLLILAVHIIVTLIVAGFYYLHIKRLNRPKWLPPVFWVVGVAIVVLFVSLLFPAGMLPQGSFTRLPGPITIDPIFLFYLPARENSLANALLWGGLVLATAAAVVLPWARRKKSVPADVSAETASQSQLGQPQVTIIAERCTGCTVCALDCPYGVIEMVERNDGKLHKYIAIEDTGLCVACGICVGSCDDVAVTLGTTPPAALWSTISSRLTLARLHGPLAKTCIVFTCERHAVHGARPYIDQTITSTNGMLVEVIGLPCVGTMPPDLLARTLDEGAAHVHIVGCPADDCAVREGNLWLEQRITRERLPRLKRPYANAPITASWLPPDDFSRGVAAIPSGDSHSPDLGGEVDYLELRRILQPLTWRNYVTAFLLLALVMVGQVILTDLPYTPYAQTAALNRIVIADIAAPIGRTSYMAGTLGPQLDLSLVVDGEMVLQESFSTTDVLSREPFPYFEQLEIEPGQHDMLLFARDPGTGTTFVYVDALVDFNRGDIITLPLPGT